MVEKLENIGFWRIVEILVPLATPLAVAAFAFLFNFWESERDQRNALEQERIARYALIPAFMDALTGSDPSKKELAVRSVTAILGDDGETLLSGLPPAQVASLSAETQQIITDATNTRATTLVDGLYNTDPSASLDALRALTLSGPRPDSVIPIMLDYGTNNSENLGGVTNSLKYLKAVDQSALVTWTPAIDSFLARVESSNQGENSALIDEVRSRLQDGTF